MRISEPSMKRLDRAQDEVEHLLKRNLDVNPVLEKIFRMDEYDANRKRIQRTLASQIRTVANSSIFKEIDEALGPIQKADRIHTEKDQIEIQKAVQNHFVSTGKKVVNAFSDFLILIYNIGGQDLLDKANLPATFELKDPAILGGIKDKAPTIFQGTDETTSQWIIDQISNGRQAGMSNADIKSNILDQVPDMTDGRANRIINTETSDMVGTAESDAATNNGATGKVWVTTGAPCEICADNESDGEIGIDESFSSGDDTEPAHPNCQCIVEYTFADFTGDIWSGG